MAAMAEHEREMISERTQAGMDGARREIAVNGFRISKTGRRFRRSAIRAGGSRSREQELRIFRRPLPAQLTEIMREKRLEGCTLRSIASYLNELGLRTLDGKQWYASTVRKAMLAHGGQIPDRPTSTPAPAEILAIMHQLRSEGATLRAIAARLNGLALKSAKGKDWHASTVRAAMLRPAA